MSTNFTIKLANATIDVSCIFDTTKDFCKDYFSTEKPDFKVEVTQEDIDFEKNKSEDKYFQDNYYETLALYRKIAVEMLKFDTFLFHGSAIAVDNEAYIFTAKSGTGKSTHAKLWREYLGDEAIMVNDDKPLIHIEEDSAYVCGTPWDGKHKLSKNVSVPIKAVCILEQSEKNNITKLNLTEAVSIFLQQTYRPQGALETKKTLDLIEKFMNNVKIYKLQCNMDISAAELSYNTMRG